MVNILGANIPVGINISGFISSSWIWVLLVVIIGVIAVGTISFVLFFRTYNRRIIVFENISGQGYQPVYKSRARVVRIGNAGVEVLKTLFGGYYVSAYGRKMGKNTYWFAKGSDGYWYNILLGDLDAKFALLDIEPVDRDVRMFHAAVDRMSHADYDKQSFLQKYGIHLLLFVFLIVLILGIWFLIGQIGKAVAPLGQSNENAQKISEINLETSAKLANIVSYLSSVKGVPEEVFNTNQTGGDSGLIPAG